MQRTKTQSSQASGQKNFQSKTTLARPSVKELHADRKTKKEEQEGAEAPHEVSNVQTNDQSSRN